jgi:hypothetical protein
MKMDEKLKRGAGGEVVGDSSLAAAVWLLWVIGMNGDW